MKLIGKCLESFKEWYQNQNFQIGYDIDDQLCFMDGIPESMQYGVLEDFFDSVGIYLNAIAFERMKYFKAIVDGNMEKRKFKNRNDALIFAINKAVEIFNERH